ncbi:hypothetical protein FLAV_02869 [Flavobacteriales bacterium]|nr:hypothetical protein FLAV_02869 [Flavobacteriales bacterium]
MNYKNKVFLIFVFFLHFIACHTQQQNEDSSIIFIKRDTLILPIEYIESISSKRYLSTNKGESFIGIGEASENSKLIIISYDLNKGKIDTLMVFDLPFESDKETITDFYYNPAIEDSIYVFSSYNIYAKHLYNEGLRIIKVNPFPKSTNQGFLYGKYFYSTNEILQMLTLVNGKYFIFKSNNLNINYKDPKQFLESIFTRIDKNSGVKIAFKNTLFPENYRAGNLYGLGSNLIPIGTYNYGNNYYYSFAKSHYIYKLNTKTGSVDKKEIKSKFIIEDWKTLNENDAFVIDKINTYNITEPKYIKLLYDSINNVSFLSLQRIYSYIF